jgi:uncharacterized damage-inducible protein DinB
MAPEDTRQEPAFLSDERSSLTAWLDYHRATLLHKCQGLDGEQLVRRSVPPSTLSLLGLVRHMWLVEWWWFERIFADGPASAPIDTEQDHDAEFNELDPDRAGDDMAAFERQCAISRSIVEAADSLDVPSRSSQRDTRDLRWIMVHMIEEYARHNGHADLLRQCVDGEVGE